MSTKKELRLLKQQQLQESFKVDDQKNNLKKYLLWVGTALVGLVALVIFFVEAGQPQSFDVTQACTTDMSVIYHIHPQLTIIINGQTQTIPSGIGILPTCFRPIHTHDATGTIHVESATQRDFTLAEFFKVWGQPFDKSHILGSTTDSTHDLTMIVDGQPSTAWGNLVLADKQIIIINYAKK